MDGRKEYVGLSMGTVFSDYIVPAAAVVGVARPWIAALAKRYVLRPQVDVFETGFVEIGFSQLGPTIGLVGTLNARRRDAFVARVDLTVRREKDNLTHLFEWVAFKPNLVGSTQRGESSFDLPYSFQVPLRQPRQYSIVFHDRETHRDILSCVAQLSSLWDEHIRRSERAASLIDSIRRTAGLSPLVTGAAEVDELAAPYRGDSRHTEVYARLGRLFYWEPGDYEMILSLRLQHPRRAATRSYRFGLSSSECDRLRLNIINILNGPVSISLGVPLPPFNFAYAEYIA